MPQESNKVPGNVRRTLTMASIAITAAVAAGTGVMLLSTEQKNYNTSTPPEIPNKTLSEPYKNSHNNKEIERKTLRTQQDAEESSPRADWSNFASSLINNKHDGNAEYWKILYTNTRMTKGQFIRVVELAYDWQENLAATESTADFHADLPEISKFEAQLRKEFRQNIKKVLNEKQIAYIDRTGVLFALESEVRARRLTPASTESTKQ